MQSATNLKLIKRYAELRYMYIVYYVANIQNNNIKIQPPINIILYIQEAYFYRLKK